MYLIKIYLHVSTTDFAKLNAFTFVWANSFRDSNFPQYLSIMQHWFMQIFLVFCCPRRGEETVYLRKRDFTVYLPNRLIYEPNETEIISQEQWKYSWFSLAIAMKTLLNMTDFPIARAPKASPSSRFSFFVWLIISCTSYCHGMQLTFASFFFLSFFSSNSLLIKLFEII